EKQPAGRYASAADLADDLRRYLNHEPIRARPVGVVGRLRRWSRRKPGVALAGGLAVLALVAGTAGSTTFAVIENGTALRGKETAGRVSTALGESEKSRSESAHRALGLGLYLCEQGDSGVGMLWLARSLEAVPQGDRELDWAIRTNLGGWREFISPLKTS